MAWPIQVHSIESDKAWQISLPRSGVTFAQPISREIIFLSGQPITSTSAMTLAATMAGIAMRRRIEITIVSRN